MPLLPTRNRRSMIAPVEAPKFRHLKFIVRKNDFDMRHTIECAIVDPGRDVISVAQPIVFQDRDDTTSFAATPPMLSFPSKCGGLQDLMNQLWQLGFRPADIGTAGHLAATQEHLSDMRKLVQSVLKVKF